jgi:hypothetical protein
LSLAIEFPVPRRVFIWRVDDRFFEELVVHESFGYSMREIMLQHKKYIPPLVCAGSQAPAWEPGREAPAIPLSFNFYASKVNY